ncbi:alpha-ribazole phosphatase [Prevotella sp. OH937_COT-195]|uniref:alpha-ribazole phosphatase n=1 Tax=Prevotella sp. OH937_COT-195 TaxID=2491051 RepID=UPI000F645162|nr:alpha-ribazole phosphatase [Prevotella sp. OH937_COT-195]RRC97680.1 alpha-ribazole phosphatase [Prevotella sp. OH937_COT-195]
MEVYMIRHTSVGVPKGTCYGWSDVPVADTFEQEATVTKGKMEGIEFDKVFSSPLTRARKLAMFCGWENPEIDDRLKEMNMGDWEMMRYEDIEKHDPEIMKWYEDYMNLAATNGESYRMVYSRVACFLNELCKCDYRRVAIFAHGGVLICAGVYAGLFPEDGCFRHLTPYGGIQVINI